VCIEISLQSVTPSAAQMTGVRRILRHRRILGVHDHLSHDIQLCLLQRTRTLEIHIPVSCVCISVDQYPRVLCVHLCASISSVRVLCNCPVSCIRKRCRVSTCMLQMPTCMLHSQRVCISELLAACTMARGAKGQGGGRRGASVQLRLCNR